MHISKIQFFSTSKTFISGLKADRQRPTSYGGWKIICINLVIGLIIGCTRGAETEDASKRAGDREG